MTQNTARNGTKVILVQDRAVLGKNSSSEIRICALSSTVSTARYASFALHLLPPTALKNSGYLTLKFAD